MSYYTDNDIIRKMVEGMNNHSEEWKRNMIEKFLVNDPFQMIHEMPIPYLAADVTSREIPTPIKVGTPLKTKLPEIKPLQVSCTIIDKTVKEWLRNLNATNANTGSTQRR